MAQHRPSEEQFRNCICQDDATRQAVNGTSASVHLAAGMWLMTCDVDFRFKQGDSSVSLSDTTKGNPVWSKQTFGPIFISDTATSYVAVISGSSGTVDFIKVS